MKTSPRKTQGLSTRCSPEFHRRVEAARKARGHKTIGQTVFWLIAEGLGIPPAEIEQLMRRAPRSPSVPKTSGRTKRPRGR